jgi:multicomponent Na+:H+ antiporter subunit E
MNGNVETPRNPIGAWFARTVGFFAFWQIPSGLSLVNCLVGLVAALIATWTSLRLMPPGQWRFRPFKLARYALRFLRQSIVAGVDVAWRALDPRMPLQPGFVVYQSKLSAGATLDAFCTVSSLLPGTLPSGPDASGGLAIHCLDVTQPVAEQLATEEALFSEAIGERQGNA